MTKVRNSVEQELTDLDDLVQPNGEENVDRDVGFDFLRDDAEADAPVENGARPHGSHGESSESMLASEEVKRFKARWGSVQGHFIDDPQRAVEQADNLVDVVIKQLTDSFAQGRDELVRKWDGGGEPPSTEDLRVVLRGYRALLDRLYRL